MTRKQKQKRQHLHGQLVVFVSLILMQTVWISVFRASNASDVGIMVVVAPPASSTSSSSSDSSSSTSSSASSTASSEISSQPTGGHRGTLEQSIERMRGLIREWELRGKTEPCAEPYQDVSETDWFYNPVRFFFCKTYVDTAQLFYPARAATRAEAAKLLVKASEIALTDGKKRLFTDVRAGTWFRPYIETAAIEKWVFGYNDCYGSLPCYFRPTSTITRAEAAAMVVRFFQLQPLKKAPRFRDNPPTAWYSKVVQTAADHCVLQGDKATLHVRPEDPVTRAELVAMLYRGMSSLKYDNKCEADWHSPSPQSPEVQSLFPTAPVESAQAPCSDSNLSSHCLLQAAKKGITSLSASLPDIAELRHVQAAEAIQWSLMIMAIASGIQAVHFLTRFL